MDRQRIFNTVFTGLRSQSFQRSFDPNNGSCKYRGPDGLKCAVGHLIPDDLYQERFDTLNIPAERLIRNQPEIEAHIGADANRKEDLRFLGAIQAVHDRHRWTDSPTMEESLREFASQYNLTVPK